MVSWSFQRVVFLGDSDIDVVTVDARAYQYDTGLILHPGSLLELRKCRLVIDRSVLALRAALLCLGVLAAY